MKSALVVLALLLAACGCAGAQTWGAYALADGTSLQIDRADLGGGTFEWTYTLAHGNASKGSIYSFSVGLTQDDTGGTGFGSLTSGSFFGYSSSVGATVKESIGNARFSDFNMSYGNTAWFKLQTDLPGVGYAAHQCTGNNYAPSWSGKETPAVPEPAGVLALVTGLVGLIARRRK